MHAGVVLASSASGSIEDRRFQTQQRLFGRGLELLNGDLALRSEQFGKHVGLHFLAQRGEDLHVAHQDFVLQVGVAHLLRGVHHREATIEFVAAPAQAARGFLAVALAQPQHAHGAFGIFDDRGILTLVVFRQHGRRRLGV